MGDASAVQEYDRGVYWFAGKAAGVGSIGGLLFGYDLGVISGALPQLRDQWCLDAEEREAVVSVLLLGCVIGALGGGVAVDRFGRKKAIMMCDGVFVVGVTILCFAPNLGVLLVGRLIVGMGVSTSAIADVAYLTEISPRRLRGVCVSTNELMITLGFLVANLVDWTFSTVWAGWRFMFGTAAIMAVVQFVLMSKMPESPRWLLTRGRDAEAKRVLRQIYIDYKLADEEYQLMAQSVDSQMGVATAGGGVALLCRWRAQLGVAVMLFFFAQFSGQANVLSYAPEMFEQAGMETTEAVKSSVWIGVGKFGCTAVIVWFVDSMPRRKLLMTGTSIMCASLLVLSLVYAGDGFVSIGSAPADQLCPCGAGVCRAKNATGFPAAYTATFNMQGISGTMSFTQASAGSGTAVRVNLKGGVASGSSYKYHVHEKPMELGPAGQAWPASCSPAATGGHYNPLNTKPELGDLSGKWGALQPVMDKDGKDEVRLTYTDKNLPLSGPTSIGGRSVVIHAPDGSRFACANIVAAGAGAAAEAEDTLGQDSLFEYVAIPAMTAVAAAYSFSFGPLCWLITSEMFDAEIRGRAIGITSVFNWFFNMLVSGSFETLVEATSTSAVFGGYFVVMCVALVCEYFLVPETRGKDPNELQFPAWCSGGDGEFTQMVGGAGDMEMQRRGLTGESPSNSRDGSPQARNAFDAAMDRGAFEERQQKMADDGDLGGDEGGGAVARLEQRSNSAGSDLGRVDLVMQ